MVHDQMGLKLRTWNLVLAGSSRSRDRHWAARFETFTGRKSWAYGGCAWKVSGPRVILFLSWFRGMVGGVKSFWNRCSSIFAF